MGKTMILVNHVQNGYLSENDPEDVALRQKILDFVEEARPHVDDIAWSYATNGVHNIPFNLAKERTETYQDNDITLVNNDGKGLDSGFLKNIYDADPDHVILIGVYFEACSADTASTIKSNLDVHVSVPMDMTNSAMPPFKTHYDAQAKRLSDQGIDVTSSSKDLLDEIIRNNNNAQNAPDRYEPPAPSENTPG